MSFSSLADFEIISKLGQGSYSTVFLVRARQSGEQFALKKVKLEGLSEREKNNALNEIRLLASISSPYVVEYKGAFHDDMTRSLCIVMEIVDGGDLLQMIRNQSRRSGTHSFDEELIWSYAIQMIKGLRILHRMKILHRDLKCANIFVSKDRKYAKIGDLNVAVIAKRGMVKTQTGTPYYASPEVWRDEPYNTKSDIWSLGCVLYEMAAGKPPFRAANMEGLYHKVQKGVFDPLPSIYSIELNRFITDCLRLRAEERPSCEDLLDCPSIVRRIDLDPHLERDSTPAEAEDGLLKTLKFPKNIRHLSSILPKPKINTNELAHEIRRSSDIRPLTRLAERSENEPGRSNSVSRIRRKESIPSLMKRRSDSSIRRTPENLVTESRDRSRDISMDRDKSPVLGSRRTPVKSRPGLPPPAPSMPRKLPAPSMAKKENRDKDRDAERLNKYFLQRKGSASSIDRSISRSRIGPTTNNSILNQPSKKVLSVIPRNVMNSIESLVIGQKNGRSPTPLLRLPRPDYGSNGRRHSQIF
eukprot:TRINITY_DN13510_c0_g1_i2.p1 TRINITY_DN13510_c0_g1~~TRINITY_DN13510_c0_g1_i2.p1  ORF type:complete len:528 (-),score=81.00 TRINITY_DN13510_c0_g1_i2:124-1707(-)